MEMLRNFWALELRRITAGYEIQRQKMYQSDTEITANAKDLLGVRDF